MPKLKPQELESRRQDIIDAARACFLRNGFHQTTTDEICHEASITPGGLYHYFASKDEIIAAVINSSAHDAVERLHELIEGSENTRSAFRLVGAFFGQSMQDQDVDSGTRLDIEIWAESLKSEKLSALSREAWVLRRKWLESLVDRALKDGIYDPESVDALGMSSLLVAIYLGMRVGRLLLKEDFDVEGALRSLVMMHSGRLRIDTPQVDLRTMPWHTAPAITPAPPKRPRVTTA